MVGRRPGCGESSATLPSSSGTLKSTRTKTLLPGGVEVADGELVHGAPAVGRRRGSSGAQPRGDVADEVGDAAAVAPLVVVPGDDLDDVAAEDMVERASMIESGCRP